tara:strand:- start:938 stop:1180 length:243 start_codon:yes stop_codon:yes gene_type:complete
MPARKEPKTPFGRAVRDKRKQQNLSQTQLASACGWSQAKLSQLETGDQQPSLLDVIELSIHLECAPSWLTSLAIQSVQAA